jgi:hypothetical protein
MSSIDPNDALADLEASFENQGEPAELLVIEPPKPPIGLSWSFDFAHGRFLGYGHGPLETHGDTSLIMWCETALRTARGAHPIFPPGYGLLNPSEFYGQDVMGAELGGMEEKVRDCLTFHPRILDIEDFEYEATEDDDAVQFAFTIVRDDDSRVPVEATVPLTVTATTGEG